MGEGGWEREGQWWRARQKKTGVELLGFSVAMEESEAYDARVGEATSSAPVRHDLGFEGEHSVERPRLEERHVTRHQKHQPAARHVEECLPFVAVPQRTLRLVVRLRALRFLREPILYSVLKAPHL